jgi:hypothetical protein
VSRQTIGSTAERFSSIPPGTYTVRATSGSQVVTSSVTVLPYSVPVTGCADEYADNFDPTATTTLVAATVCTGVQPGDLVAWPCACQSIPAKWKPT